MGNTSSTAVQKCLESALDNHKELLAFKATPFYQLKHVRPYNLDNPVTPLAITYPQSASHIAATIKCASDNGLKVQARSGGHSYANYALGGGGDGKQSEKTIVVDLKNFKQFSMDTKDWVATIGAGTLLGDVTKRLHENGNRAMAHGTCPQVGIGGHATIGGLGPISRLWGASLDHVLEVEVVLADSSIVRASPTSNPDVFFAVKGAASGFGIVTEFKVRTQPEPEKTVLYSYRFHGGNAKEKANAFKQWQALITRPDLSRKFASQFILTEQLGAIVSGTFFGSQEEYNSLNISGRMPNIKDSDVVEFKDWLGVVGHWAEDVALNIVGGIQSHFYSKSVAYTKNDILPDTAVDSLFEYIEHADKGGAVWFIIWDLEGGAINDVSPTETAYGHRDTLFYHQAYAVNLLGKINDKTRAFLTGVNRVVQDALPNHNLGAYAGYVDPALGKEDVSAKLYWGDNVDKLRKIKTRIDPLDVFSNYQSVKPAKQMAKARAVV